MTIEATRALPLIGRVIAVTRAREQAGRFAALLEGAGARVLLVPTIYIGPPDSWAPLDAALSAEPYHWALFTSVNGVEMVRRRLQHMGRGAEALASCRIAARADSSRVRHIDGDCQPYDARRIEPQVRRPIRPAMLQGALCSADLLRSAVAGVCRRRHAANALASVANQLAA